jgi:hypothetical protein
MRFIFLLKHFCFHQSKYKIQCNAVIFLSKHFCFHQSKTKIQCNSFFLLKHFCFHQSYICFFKLKQKYNVIRLFISEIF